MKREPQSGGMRPVAFKSRDAAEAYLSKIAPSISQVRFADTDAEFSIDYAGGKIGRSGLHRGSHPEVSFSVSEGGEVHMLLPMRSAIEFQDRDGTISGLPQRSGLLLPPNAIGRAVTQESFAGISLFAPVADLNEHAKRMLDPDKEVRLDLGTPRSADLADPVIEALSRNMVTACHELLSVRQNGLNAIVRAQFDELLIGLLTVAVSDDMRRALDGTPLEPSVDVVRKAQEYIRAHLDQPFRMAELAESLGVGLRSLQLGFRRAVGCSPRDFLMRCRLERARELLLAVGADAKVATIAMDCGFSDLAHFSRSYREAFGELPSVTLRRRRRPAGASP